MSNATEYRTFNIGGVIVKRPVSDVKFTPIPQKIKPKFKQGYGKVKSAEQLERERVKRNRNKANRAARAKASRDLKQAHKK